jgi:hypothetical protein
MLCTIFARLQVGMWVKAHYWGGGEKCCHFVLFSRGVHVWASTMVIFEHIFPKVLHNMVDYNKKKSIVKKFLFLVYIVWFWNIFVAKKCSHYALKNENMLKKWLKWFLVFMKFVISIKHCDSKWLEYVCEPCEEFDNYHITNVCFWGRWP